MGSLASDGWRIRVLKPIRVTVHNAFQRDGPDERFDPERSEAWIRRFDER